MPTFLGRQKTSMARFDHMILIKAVWCLLVAICLALEMYGIIKKHSGLMIFSCVFRIFYVIGNVVVCIIDLYRVTVWKGTYFRATTPHKIKAKTACKTVPWSKLRFSIFVWSAVCIIGAFRLENFENSQKRTMGLTIFNI